MIAPEPRNTIHAGISVGHSPDIASTFDGTDAHLYVDSVYISLRGKWLTRDQQAAVLRKIAGECDVLADLVQGKDTRGRIA